MELLGKLYKPTQYKLNEIAPPPGWSKNSRWVDANGNYKEILRLWEDERFQVWMRVAALPAFRKLYGKYDFDIYRYLCCNWLALLVSALAFSKVTHF